MAKEIAIRTIEACLRPIWSRAFRLSTTIRVALTVTSPESVKEVSNTRWHLTELKDPTAGISIGDGDQTTMFSINRMTNINFLANQMKRFIESAILSYHKPLEDYQYALQAVQSFDHKKATCRKYRS